MKWMLMVPLHLAKEFESNLRFGDVRYIIAYVDYDYAAFAFDCSETLYLCLRKELAKKMIG